MAKLAPPAEIHLEILFKWRDDLDAAVIAPIVAAAKRSKRAAEQINEPVIVQNLRMQVYARTI